MKLIPKVRTKEQLKKQAAHLAGEIFDKLNSGNCEFTICKYFDEDDDEADILIRMHYTDDLNWIREQEAIRRGEL